MNIHYAVQTCDSASFQSQKRYCSDDRAEITRKSVTSLLLAIRYVAEVKPHIKHTVKILDDNSSQSTKEFLLSAKELFSSENIVITVDQVKETGIHGSIKECYEWLASEGIDFVYQIQDDYVFEQTAIYDMLDIFFRLNAELQTHPVVTPYNDPYLWRFSYRNRTVPRAIFVGEKQYWLQNYDIACTFLTTKQIFMQHYDLMEEFLDILVNPDKKNQGLEKDSLNKMFSERNVLGVIPFKSVALHMQSELEKDLYIDWKQLWDSIPSLDELNNQASGVSESGG